MIVREGRQLIVRRDRLERFLALRHVSANHLDRANCSRVALPGAPGLGLSRRRALLVDKNGFCSPDNI